MVDWVWKATKYDGYFVAEPREIGTSVCVLVVSKAAPENKKVPKGAMMFTFEIKEAGYGGKRHYHSSSDAPEDEAPFFPSIELAKEAAEAKYAETWT